MTKIIDITKRVYSGGTPDTRKSEYWNGNIKWLSSGETRNNFVYDTDKKITELGVLNSSTKLANRNSIVMACAGQGFTRGQTSYLMDDMYINQSVICIDPDEEKVDGLYLYYYFKNSYQMIRNLSDDHSSRGSITTAMIKNLEVDFPNLVNQKKISTILYSLDKQIELNNKINNNLSKLCNNIFHDYLDKYDDKIEYKKIADIANKIVTGKTPSTANKDFWDGSIPFITIPDMHNQIFTIKTERNITELGAKSIIPKNSLSVSCIATVGLVSINTEESQTNQQINSIVLNNDYDLYFLYEYLSEQEEFMKNIAGGSTTYNINKNTFENIEVPYLPNKELLEFHNRVSNIFEKIKLNQYENERLVQLRDTLLSKLMNGEIDLNNIEI